MLDFIELPGWLAQLLAIGLSSVGGAGIFAKLFGERWINSKFEKEMESFKAENERQLHRLRIEIDTTIAKANTIIKYDYDALPEVWKHLSFALRQISNAVNPTITRIVSDMDIDELDDFIEAMEFNKEEARYLKTNQKKPSALAKVIQHQQQNRAIDAINKAALTFAEKRIFLPDHINIKIDEAFKSLQSVLAKQMAINEVTKEKLDDLKEAQSKIESLGKIIREYLHDFNFATRLGFDHNAATQTE